MATFDNEVILIGYTGYTYVNEGNEVKMPYETTVLCNELSVYSTEFYNAANVGLKPHYVLSIHDFEYNKQEKVIYKGEELDILRTYKNVRTGLIELTVGEKIGS